MRGLPTLEISSDVIADEDIDFLEAENATERLVKACCIAADTLLAIELHLKSNPDQTLEATYSEQLAKLKELVNEDCRRFGLKGIRKILETAETMIAMSEDEKLSLTQSIKERKSARKAISQHIF